jgi:DNA (cytosine-5)-methyltransferase 1
VAWEPLGWSALWFSQYDPEHNYARGVDFPSAVLAHHWPEVPNFFDMLKIPELIRMGVAQAPDVFIAGTPCQSFSVAGLRKGLSDERGNVTLAYIQVLNEIDRQRERGRECVGLWENVPGVLSSKDNAFGCLLAGLVGEEQPLQPAGRKWSNAGCVFGPQRSAAWRVLDAQYFGVAQRRRRVFVVTSARDGFDPTAVLFESDGLRRDTPPSRETREEATADVGKRTIPYSWAERHNGAAKISPTLDARLADGPRRNQGGVTVVSMAHGQGGAEVRIDGGAPCLTCNHEAPIACYPVHDKATRHAGQTGRGSGNGLGVGKNGDPSPTLTVGDKHAVGTIAAQSFTCGMGGRPEGAAAGHVQVTAEMQVRRLTPVECERLQGFPDNHTAIEWRGKAASECPDGPRYKAIGNSMAVPVIRWLGERTEQELERCNSTNGL